MRAKTDESPGIKSKMDDVAEAVAAVKRDLIGELPKMRRAGRTDVSDLAVSVNALNALNGSIERGAVPIVVLADGEEPLEVVSRPVQTERG